MEPKYLPLPLKRLYQYATETLRLGCKIRCHTDEIFSDFWHVRLCGDGRLECGAVRPDPATHGTYLYTERPAYIEAAESFLRQYAH